MKVQFKLQNNEPGQESGAASQAPASFDSVMDTMFKGVTEAVAKAETEVQVPPAQPHATAGDQLLGTAPPAPAPQVPPAQVAQVPVDQFAQIGNAMASLAQQSQLTTAALQRLLEQNSPQQTQQQQQEEQPPDVQDLVKKYRMPERQANESDADYAGRAQAGLWNHINNEQAKYMERKAQKIAESAVSEYQRRIDQQMAQQQAQHQFQQQLARSVREVGVDPSSDVGNYLAMSVRNHMVTLAQDPRSQSWSQQQWDYALKRTVEYHKGFIRQPPPVVQPGQQPNLSVVPGGVQQPASAPPTAAPIAMGTQAAPPATVPSGAPPKAKNWNEMLDNLWGGVAKASG